MSEVTLTVLDANRAIYGNVPGSDAAENIWERTFATEEFFDQMPVSQLVPIAYFGFAAMVGELNQDIRELADDPTPAHSQQETLNRLIGNLRTALAESPELTDSTLDRLVGELTDLAEQYPSIGKKCADLSRRLQEFPAKLEASAARNDMPI